MSSASLAGKVPPALAHQRKFVTVRVGEQMFGLPVEHVQDVIRKQRITPIPLAPNIVAGALNLRGRIVTAIHLRKRLGLPEYPDADKLMKVVVEYHHELYALMVDNVGEVLTLSELEMEKPPANMDPIWRSLATGVFKLDHTLLIILDIEHIVEI